MSPNPSKDRVAIVGVGSTGFTRELSGRSPLALAVAAAKQAVADAGLSGRDVDGVCSTAPAAIDLVTALGLRDVTHHATLPPPVGFALIDGLSAIFSGQCETVLVCHAVYRSPTLSRAAAADPFRRFVQPFGTVPGPRSGDPQSVAGAIGYAAWAGRYLHEVGVGRQVFGPISVNARRNAMQNPLAAVREPVTLEDHAAARPVREPLTALDLDIPVDGADAFVLTSAERAMGQRGVPVLVHAAATGVTAPVDEAQACGLHRHGQHVVAAALRRRSDLWLNDVDVFLPYDGASFIALSWIENLGWCGFGEGGALLEGNCQPDGRLLLGGRVPVNPHGGGLGEGANQGSGHVREAAMQLRGEAGERQVPGAACALVTLGGFFNNAQGFVLRRA